jgi:hypothetical protein
LKECVGFDVAIPALRPKKAAHHIQRAVQGEKCAGWRFCSANGWDFLLKNKDVGARQWFSCQRSARSPHIRPSGTFVTSLYPLSRL